ncbi:hypothetical protein BUALT_Bualt10G0010400 [Buddleja alternifolia]|uniref:Reverse transcriptase n=1 Tax=Buddleja alternifolia TaxID=168488 RepID=A0AAV6X3R2_9LAMI|nr:hypothetical protein BUALT_Bualt10G0010400 [Buddleja alternifolia]
MKEFGDMIIDRGILDAGYKDDILRVQVKQLARSHSDHATLLFLWEFSSPTIIPPVQFIRMWIKHHQFLEFVKSNWIPPTESFGMINLQQKLYRLKPHLKWWNKSIFGNIFDKVHRAEIAVKTQKTLFDNDPSDNEPFRAQTP